MRHEFKINAILRKWIHWECEVKLYFCSL